MNQLLMITSMSTNGNRPSPNFFLEIS